MRFSDFVQLMHRYIGCSVTQQEYVLYLTNLVIRDPMTDDEEKLDENDDFNPLSSKDVSTLSKIYSGAQNRKIKQDDARAIQSRFSKSKFVDAFQTVDYEAREEYLNLTGARFNLSSFDIEVNGETKASHGKGYHSYLNTVVALAFRNYFHDHAKYNADFLIIDTPLHGFDENDTELPDSMKDGLFKYFVHHLTGQLIIVENTDHVPSNIDFEALGANVITFTKKLNEGRYGFLHDVY